MLNFSSFSQDVTKSVVFKQGSVTLMGRLLVSRGVNKLKHDYFTHGFGDFL